MVFLQIKNMKQVLVMDEKKMKLIIEADLKKSSKQAQNICNNLNKMLMVVE